MGFTSASVVLALMSVVVAPAQVATPCSPEVKEARDLLAAKTAGVRQAKPPRAALAGARAQEIPSPRGAAPGHASALGNARKLLTEADAACKQADEPRAAANARAALELLKYLP